MKLLPCPFCGGEDIRVRIGLVEFVDGEVTCQVCGCNVGNYPSKQEAIDAWNLRTPAGRSLLNKEAQKNE